MIEIPTVNYTLYRGSDFFIKNRFRDGNNNIINLTGSTVYFDVSYGKGGASFLSYDSTGSNVTITDNIITCKIPKPMNPNKNLYYRIDVLGTNGIRTPWIQGDIKVDGV